MVMKWHLGQMVLYKGIPSHVVGYRNRNQDVALLSSNVDSSREDIGIVKHDSVSSVFHDRVNEGTPVIWTNHEMVSSVGVDNGIEIYPMEYRNGKPQSQIMYQKTFDGKYVVKEVFFNGRHVYDDNPAYILSDENLTVLKLAIDLEELYPRVGNKSVSTCNGLIEALFGEETNCEIKDEWVSHIIDRIKTEHARNTGELIRNLCERGAI